MTRRAIWIAAAALAAAGCGGDEENGTGTKARTETAPKTEAEEPRATVTSPGPAPEATAPRESPEDQPGGAGDEEPARALALLTGENGRITPRRVRVPAYISIRVELRSQDGQEYGLRFQGANLRVSGGLSSVSTTLEGLRPGEAVVGTPTGPGNRVRIEATAEPGP